jgi:hypothetical protein
MAEPHVTLNPSQLTPSAQKLRGPLEDQLSSALQLATDKVRADYRGEPVEQVCRRLLAEMRAALHPDIAEAFQPDDGELRRVADEIVRLSSR